MEAWGILLQHLKLRQKIIIIRTSGQMITCGRSATVRINCSNSEMKPFEFSHFNKVLLVHVKTILIGPFWWENVYAIILNKYMYFQ